MVQFLEDGDPPPVVAEPVATEAAESHRTPWHLWAVGGISAAWNLMGVTDYTFTQLGNRTWVETGAANMGITAEEMLAYVDAFPVWVHAAWALGVWGAIAGSILLLVRSRHAVAAFAVSLLGLAVTQLYRAFTPQPAWAEGDLAFNLMLWSVATFLLIYAGSMKRKGVIS